MAPTGEALREGDEFFVNECVFVLSEGRARDFVYQAPQFYWKRCLPRPQFYEVRWTGSVPDTFEVSP